jgi:hypothetical protein
MAVEANPRRIAGVFTSRYMVLLEDRVMRLTATDAAGFPCTQSPQPLLLTILFINSLSHGGLL